LAMKISIAKKTPESCKTEALIVGCHEDTVTSLEGAARRLNEKGGGLLSRIVDLGDFTGKLNETKLVYTEGKLPSKRILMLGLGPQKELTREKIRVAFAGAARTLRESRIRSFSLSLDFGNDTLHLYESTSAAVEGMLLGLYRFETFKTARTDPPDVSSITLIADDPSSAEMARKSLHEARIICDAVTLTRDLVTTPANEMTPSKLADTARQAGRSKTLSVNIIDATAMKRIGMNALLGVACGSAQPPKLIVLNYQGGASKSAPVVLVGKGVTFDSGGLDLKPTSGMETMKDDMAGGAVVLSVLKAAAALKLPLNLVGLVPSVENMPGDRAYRPGDVLRSLSGQTIEVVNTDAEGRLILADALTYARRFKPAVLIDIATLTGACIVALGDHLTGMLGNDNSLKDLLRTASETTGETLWELPLWEEYDDLIKSDVADMKNAGARSGGAITAALFLKKFVGDTPWAHLDIAGPSFLAKDKGYIPKGASGVGVRLLLEFLKQWSRDANGSNS
jgi:leucyl aminopeptidase